MTTAGLLDTSVFIAAESGRALDLDRLPDESLVCVVTLAELEAGVLAAPTTEIRARRLRTAQRAAAIAPLPIDDAIIASLEEFIATYMEAFGIPGAAVGIVENGELIYSKGFGVADPATVEVDHRREVEVEAEGSERATHPPPGAAREDRRQAREVGGSRRRADQVAQAIDAPALGIEREDQPGRRGAQRQDQLAQALGVREVALHQHHSRRPHARQQRPLRGFEARARDADEQQRAPFHLPSLSRSAATRLRAASGVSRSRSTSRRTPATSSSAGVNSGSCRARSSA